MNMFSIYKSTPKQVIILTFTVVVLSFADGVVADKPAQGHQQLSQTVISAKDSLLLRLAQWHALLAQNRSSTQLNPETRSPGWSRLFANMFPGAPAKPNNWQLLPAWLQQKIKLQPAKSHYWVLPQLFKPANQNPLSGFFAPSSNRYPAAWNNSSPGYNTGLYNNLTAPVINGMIGISAPIAMNMVIASMNPTTLANFFALMTKPGPGMVVPYGYNPIPAMPNPEFPFSLTDLKKKFFTQ